LLALKPVYTTTCMSESRTRIKELEEEIDLLRKQSVTSERLSAEKALLEQEYQDTQLRFKTIFKEAAVGMKLIDSDLKIIKANRALCRLLGYDEAELIGIKITDIAHAEFKDHWKQLQHELWNEGTISFAIDTCIFKKNGATIWCHVNSIRFQDGDKMLGYTIIEDISERKELERIREEVHRQQILFEQLRSEKQQQRKVLEATVNTQEEERRRIAEGLHNSIGQLLFAAKLALEQVKFADPKSEIDLIRSKEIIAECMMESRRISHNLMPTILADFGLKKTVLDICQKMESTVKFKCQVKKIPDEIDKHLQIVIYRVMQELMLNVVKHARATTATVTLTSHHSKILITVQDDGVGFDPDQSSMGIGLKTIRNSIYLFEGSLDVKSKQGGGTIISIELPLS
jgi:PAS domain S-box-containing protein